MSAMAGFDCLLCGAAVGPNPNAWAEHTWTKRHKSAERKYALHQAGFRNVDELISEGAVTRATAQRYSARLHSIFSSAFRSEGSKALIARHDGQWYVNPAALSVNVFDIIFICAEWADVRIGELLAKSCTMSELLPAAMAIYQLNRGDRGAAADFLRDAVWPKSAPPGVHYNWRNVDLETRRLKNRDADDAMVIREMEKRT